IAERVLGLPKSYGPSPARRYPRRLPSPATRERALTAHPLLLRRQQVLETAQGERIAGDAKAGDDALADRGGLRGGAAPDRVRDVHLDRRELDLRERGDQRRVSGAESGRVEDRRIDAAIVRVVDLVDHLAFDVRVEDLDLEAEFGGVAADPLVILRHGHRTEDPGLHLAAHVHAGAVDDEDSRHWRAPSLEWFAGG